MLSGMICFLLITIYIYLCILLSVSRTLACVADVSFHFPGGKIEQKSDQTSASGASKKKKWRDMFFIFCACSQFRSLRAFANNEQATLTPVNRPFSYSRYWNGTSL